MDIEEQELQILRTFGSDAAGRPQWPVKYRVSKLQHHTER